MSPRCGRIGRDAADHEANVLGALALVIGDRVSGAVAGASGLSDSSAAAVSALAQFLDGATLDRLRQTLGLTPSGAVRIVDRLAEAGLVTRGSGEDKRSRSLALTPLGQETAARIRSARLDALHDVLTRLDPATRSEVSRVLGSVLDAAVMTKDGGAWTCRLCDLDACGRGQGICPAANAAERRFGPLTDP